MCISAMARMLAQQSAPSLGPFTRGAGVNADCDLCMQIPPTSILTLDPLFCSNSALRVILACRSATNPSSASRHYIAKDFGTARASVGSQPLYRGSQSQSIGNSCPSMGNSSLSSRSAERQPQPEGLRWPNNQQGQRHHLLLPKALPQGNLSRYFDLACVTSGLRCLEGQQDAWEDAWLVLHHALDNLTGEGTFCKGTSTYLHMMSYAHDQVLMSGLMV